MREDTMGERDDWVSMSMPYLTPREEGRPDAWAEEAAGRGRKGTQRILFAGEVQAGPEVAALLGLAEGEPVIVRRRVIELDGETCELTDTYYPVAIARGTPLAGTAKIRGGAVTLLAALGHVGVRIREDVTARMATTEERDVLKTGTAQPVLRIARLTLDADERPLQADLMTMPAHRQRLRYELRIG
ncbi:GntR family transcriptional regulator [Streptomyces sp. NPDC047928]|uniref:GntR family transcriptional regulator n=1 Tax=unclassified Streptomyces TaxID=2593676 RepID=UPI00371968F5